MLFGTPISEIFIMDFIDAREFDIRNAIKRLNDLAGDFVCARNLDDVPENMRPTGIVVHDLTELAEPDKSVNFSAHPFEMGFFTNREVQWIMGLFRANRISVTVWVGDKIVIRVT
jgi:hypothetical protein